MTLPTREEVLADLPEREHVYDMDELENLAVAYDMELLKTRAEWEATIDRCEHGVLLMKGTGHQIDGNLWCRAAVGAECFGGDPACPCQDGDLCHYRGDNASPPIHTTSELPDHQRPGVAVGEEREVYVTTCKNHSGGPASPHVLECFKELAAVEEDTP